MKKTVEKIVAVLITIIIITQLLFVNNSFALYKRSNYVLPVKNDAAYLTN